MLRTGAAWLEPARMIVPMTAGGRVIGTLTLEVDGRVYDAQDVLVAEDFGLRAGAAVENARLYRGGVGDRAGAADLAAAAAPAGHPGRDAGRRLPPGGPGPRGRRRLLRRLHHRRGPVVPGDRRRLRQGRRGRGGDRAGALHAAHARPRGGARRRRSCAGSARRCSTRTRAGGRFCTIACAHLDLARDAGARDGGLRRASAAGAAARRRQRRAVRRARARCSGCCPTRSCRTAAPTCARATRSCSTPTG